VVFKSGMIPHNKKQLFGQRFYRLLVIGGLNSRDNRSIWLCRCDCGRQIEVPALSLGVSRNKSFRGVKEYVKNQTSNMCKERSPYEIWKNCSTGCSR